MPDKLLDKVFKWIAIYALLAVGVVALFSFLGILAVVLLMLIHLFAFLTLSGIFASYLLQKEKQSREGNGSPEGERRANDENETEGTD